MLIRVSIITDGGIEVYSHESQDYHLPVGDPQLLAGFMTALQSFSEQIDNPIQQIQFSNMMLYIRTYGDFGIHLLFEEKISEDELEKSFTNIAKEVIPLLSEEKRGQYPPEEEFETVLLPIISQYIKDPLENTKIAYSSPSKSTSRIAIVGLAKAGKTTLKNQFFEKWSKKMIENIRPTIGLQMRSKIVDYLDQRFTVLDFGGQSQYRQMYLRDENRWRFLSILIFVIDIQDIESFNSAKDYLDKVWKMVLKVNEKHPKLSIFFHKCDEDKREILYENIKIAISTFKNYSEIATFHLSTIDNNSGIIAFVKTLYFSLPEIILRRLIEDKFLAHLEAEILPKFKSLVNQDGFLALIQDLKPRIRRSALNYGLKYGHLMQEEWLKYILGEWQPEERLLSSKSLQLDVQGQYMFLTIPGYSEIGYPGQLSTLLIDGALEGILKTFHLDKPEIISDDGYHVSWKITI